MIEMCWILTSENIKYGQEINKAVDLDLIGVFYLQQAHAHKKSFRSRLNDSFLSFCNKLTLIQKVLDLDLMTVFYPTATS